MKRFLAVFLMLAILLTGLTVTANAATTGWKKQSDGTWTYTKADGKLATDEWILDGGTWYYFSGTTMVADGIWWVKDKFYAFTKSGAMVANSWYKETYEDETYWFYAGADGALVEDGWQLVDKKWYYFWGIGMVSDTILPIEKGEIVWDATEKTPFYIFDKSGAMVENGWYNLGDATYPVWAYAKDGVAAKGWIQDGRNWYYLSKSGIMWTGWYNDETNKVWYYLDEKSGAMATGWKKIGDYWYYFKDSGAEVENDWVETNGKWYYLQEGGEMAVNTTITWKGKEYKVGADGAWDGK